jgi:hypothetical protein
VETAMAWAKDQPPNTRARRQSLGTAADVRAALDGVAAEFDADEMMLVNIMPDHQARVNSYALIAHEYGLVSARQAA